MKAFGSVLAAIAMLAAAPALAQAAAGDTKAGVDAWGRGDFAGAVAIWRPLAVAGDADAQFNMGQAYKLGRGVPKDWAMAESWYRKAAQQGHMQAEDNLGLNLYEQGKKADAVPFLERSVARDERRAELVLGTMLFNGDGVTRDWPRAYALVTRSSQQGLSQASQTLAQMDQYLPPEQQQQGTRMAAEIAQTAKLAPMSASPAAAPRPVEPRPSARPAGKIRTAEVPPSQPAPLPEATAKVPPAPRPAPAARPAPRPAPVATATRGGKWRIQLGAFRDEGNARDLWARVGGRTGGSVVYAKAGGGVTRLQATGFASKAAASAACAKSRVSCVVVAP